MLEPFVRPIFSANEPFAMLFITSPFLGTSIAGIGFRVDTTTYRSASEIAARMILFRGPAVRTALF